MSEINLNPSDEEINAYLSNIDSEMENWLEPLEPYAVQDADIDSVQLLLFIDDRIRNTDSIVREVYQNIRTEIFGQRLEV